jgi:hypothetical protein
MALVIWSTPGFPASPWKWRMDASAILRRPHRLTLPGSDWTYSMRDPVCWERSAILMRGMMNESYSIIYINNTHNKVAYI